MSDINDKKLIKVFISSKVTVKVKKFPSWEKENIKNINEYNKRIRENGLFSDGLRSF